MAVFQEFRAFIQRGNVIDLAVGVIIGGAFGKIVTSLVEDLIMPLVGVVTAGVDFASLSFSLGEGPSAAVLKYGKYIQHCVDFLITAFCVFMLVRLVNALRSKPEPAAVAPPEPTPTEKLLTEIRDALVKR